MLRGRVARCLVCFSSCLCESSSYQRTSLWLENFSAFTSLWARTSKCGFLTINAFKAIDGLCTLDDKLSAMAFTVYV